MAFEGPRSPPDFHLSVRYCCSRSVARFTAMNPQVDIMRGSVSRSLTNEASMPINVIIEDSSELPNGLYAEMTATGSYGVHIPDGTTYNEVCEAVRAKLSDQFTGGLMGLRAMNNRTSKVAVSMTLEVVSCEFKGGLVRMDEAAASGDHVLKYTQSMNRTTTGKCCTTM